MRRDSPDIHGYYRIVGSGLHTMHSPLSPRKTSNRMNRFKHGSKFFAMFQNARSFCEAQQTETALPSPIGSSSPVASIITSSTSRPARADNTCSTVLRLQPFHSEDGASLAVYQHSLRVLEYPARSAEDFEKHGPLRGAAGKNRTDASLPR